MEIQIRREGKLNTVDIDVDVANLTAQEAERVEGVTTAKQRAVPSNRVFRAIVWAKLLHTPFADVRFDEIDLVLSELAEFAETPDEVAWVADGDSVVIPMETATGTVDAEVSLG